MSLALPRGRTNTSRLGFGTAYLAGGFEARANQRLVDVALDAGIRHFDTAPSYGMGLAEDVLGMILTGRRDQVTIASKVGISRPQPAPHVRLARALARPVRRHLGGWARGIGQRAYRASVSRGHFDVRFVETSLSETLRRLRTDYLDLLLLHEVRLEDITDDLLTFLDKRRVAGSCLAVGTATSCVETHRILDAYDGVFDVIQHSWSVLDDNLPTAPPPLTITHRAVLKALTPLAEWLSRDPSAKRELAEAAAVDLDAPDALPNLVLGAALAVNPNGLVLVASRRADRIRSNAQVQIKPSLIEAGERFLRAIVEHGDRPKPLD